MNFISTQEINELLKDPAHAILAAEKDFKSRVTDIAKRIQKSAVLKPIVLLTGPSGSGKTTAARIIESVLDTSGLETHTISLDNYFYNRPDGNLPLDDDGNPDLESPLRLDTDLLRTHMRALSRCEPIEVPIFDFPTQSRTNETIPLHRKPGEVVIFEGIHALNPLVSGDRSCTTGIYISVRTRVTCGSCVLHPSLIRLMRRLMRDKNHRAQSFEDTINRLKSVTRGEHLFIDPYKNTADVQIDSFCPYELSVYRDILLPELSALPEDFLREKGVFEIPEVLSSLEPVSQTLVPEGALIHEFLH